MFTGREWIKELGIYDYRHRFYHPGFGRFLQSDPLGLQTEGVKLTAGEKALFFGGQAPEAFSSSEMNLFRYCGDDPVENSDPLGLETYSQNRDFDFLGGGVAYTSKMDPSTHTFVFTTNADGSIAHTYSWGNEANKRGWHLDVTIDKRAAAQAMKLPAWLRNKKGDSNLDPYVQKAYDTLNKKENEHQNWGITRHCKDEAKNLLSLAKKLQKEDAEMQKRKEAEKQNLNK